MTTEMMNVDGIEQCRKAFHAILGPDGAEDIEVLCDMARLAATEIPGLKKQGWKQASRINELEQEQIREGTQLRTQLTAAHAREQEMREAAQGLLDCVVSLDPETTDAIARLEKALSHPTDTKALEEGK